MEDEQEATEQEMKSVLLGILLIFAVPILLAAGLVTLLVRLL